MSSLCTVRRCKFLLKLCLKLEPQSGQVNTLRRCAWSVRMCRASELCTLYDAPHMPHTCRPRACSDQWARSSVREACPRPQVEHTHPPGGAAGSSLSLSKKGGAPPPGSPSTHTTHSARNNTTSKQPPRGSCVIMPPLAFHPLPAPLCGVAERADERPRIEVRVKPHPQHLRLPGHSYCGVLSRRGRTLNMLLPLPCTKMPADTGKYLMLIWNMQMYGRQMKTFIIMFYEQT